jgi:hypothetical protein
MQRRKFIAGMGSLAAAGAAGIGTGAFTSVSADRTLTVDVAGDASAYLALEPSDGPNAEFATETGDTLEINFTDSEEGGSGLNEDARTVIRDVFKITNQGTQDVFVWVENDTVPDGIGVYSDSPAHGSGSSTGLGNNKEGNVDDGKRDNADLPPVSVPATNEVPVGETMDEIGFSFNTGSRGNLDADDLTFDMTIVAQEVDQYSDYPP